MRGDEQRWWDELKDGRRFHRVPADAPAALVSTALGRVRATVLDISQGGCRVRVGARCHDGDRFVLKLEMIGPRAVAVAWHRDEEVGLVFAEPLGWAAVAQVAAIPNAGGYVPYPAGSTMVGADPTTLARHNVPHGFQSTPVLTPSPPLPLQPSPPSQDP